MGAVGGEELVVLEVAAGGQDHVRVGEAVRHHHVRADDEQVLARQPAAHPVLVGMHDERVVVVDEERLERRRQRGVREVAADVDDVERARAVRHEVRSRQLRGRLGKRPARAVDEAAALDAELAGERREREHGADAAAAVLVALEPVADADGHR